MSFDAQAYRALEWAGGGSGYLSEVLAQRHHLITQCLAYLVGEGWGHGTIARACEESAAAWQVALGGGGVGMLRNVAELRGPADGMPKVEAVDVSDREVYALAVLAGEWWAGHAGLKAYLATEGKVATA